MNKSITAFVITIAIGVASFPSVAIEHMAKPDHNSAQAEKVIRGEGVVISTEAKTQTVKLKHGPMPDLGWPAMTMKFKVQDKVKVDHLKKGDKVKFILKAEGEDYVITSIK
jgi:Cu(I)/Ag(I) efflux system protein CusF